MRGSGTRRGFRKPWKKLDNFVRPCKHYSDNSRSALVRSVGHDRSTIRGLLVMSVQIDIIQKKSDVHHLNVIREIREISEQFRKQFGENVDVVNAPVASTTQEVESELRKLRSRLERGEGIDLGILVLLGYAETEIASLREEAEESLIEIICAKVDWEYKQIGQELR